MSGRLLDRPRSLQKVDCLYFLLVLYQQAQGSGVYNVYYVRVVEVAMRPVKLTLKFDVDVLVRFFAGNVICFQTSRTIQKYLCQHFLRSGSAPRPYFHNFLEFPKVGSKRPTAPQKMLAEVFLDCSRCLETQYHIANCQRKVSTQHRCQISV